MKMATCRTNNQIGLWKEQGKKKDERYETNEGINIGRRSREQGKEVIVRVKPLYETQKAKAMTRYSVMSMTPSI